MPERAVGMGAKKRHPSDFSLLRPSLLWMLRTSSGVRWSTIDQSIARITMSRWGFPAMISRCMLTMTWILQPPPPSMCAPDLWTSLAGAPHPYAVQPHLTSLKDVIVCNFR